MPSRSWRSRSTCSWIGCSSTRSRIRRSAAARAVSASAGPAVAARAAAVAVLRAVAAGKAGRRVRRVSSSQTHKPRRAAGVNNTPGVRMSRLGLAALAGVFLCSAVEAQTYEAVDWLKVPAGRETLGQMHGDIAVSRAGEVYVSVETERMGVQVFSPDGRYLRSLEKAPADLHGFVIRDSGDGEHLYGVSLRGQKFVKMTLGGEIVLEISRDAIPREYWTPNRFSTELGVLLSGMDVAPNGDLYVTDGYSSDYVHRFDSKGKYLGTFGGKAAPYGFNILHKIAMDTRFTPVRIIAAHGLHHRRPRRGDECRGRSVRGRVQHVRPRAQVRPALTQSANVVDRPVVADSSALIRAAAAGA